MKPNHSDPVIDEVREVRHRISAKFGHDPAKLVAYYIQLQEKYRDRLIGTEKTVSANLTIAEPLSSLNPVSAK